MIPGYRILHEIGRGGMATVFRAVQESLGREVALKVMKPELARDAAYAERFLREGKVVARLRHRNIVTIHDLGIDDAGSPYMAMEYVPGGSVASRIERMDIHAVLRCTREMALALQHAHEHGIIHRDMKPENILCHDDGSFLLSDFGVARLSEATSSLTAEGDTLGTPHYMSPEQWRGEKLDGRSDLYALGVVLYQMLAGSAPYSGTDGWSIGMQHMTSKVPRLQSDKAMFQPLVDCLLAKSRDDRPVDGDDVARRVDALLASLGLSATVASKPAPAGLTTPMPVRSMPPPPPVSSPAITVARPGSQKPVVALLVGLGLALLLAVIGVGYFVVKRLMPTQDAPETPIALAAPAAATTDAGATGDAALAEPATADTAVEEAVPEATTTTSATDTDIPAQLAELGVKFQVDSDGDYQIVQPTGNSRTQMLWIRKPIFEYGSLRIREVMSLGYRSGGDSLSGDIANLLLEDSQARKLGTWTRVGGTAQFVVKIPASASTEELAGALEATRSTADEMEQKLTGAKDEF